MDEQSIYLPQKVFTGERWLTDYAVVVKNGTVDELLHSSFLAPSHSVKTLPNLLLVPAFIDLQIYGAGNKLFAAHPSAETLQLMYQHCVTGGTALFQPTVATNDVQIFYKCIDAVKEYWNFGGKGVHGLHLEGPWINPEKRGAHVEAFIHSPSMDEVKELLQYGAGTIKMITLAPEQCSKEVLDHILNAGIIISAGHSNATYQQAVNSFNSGISTGTHLFNAMSSFQHREPGLVGAVLNDDNVMSSIIPDGYHTHFAAVSIAKKIMGERLFVITDAVAETEDGLYQHQFDGDKYLFKGVLSGSALTMHKAFLNLVNHVQVGIDEALRMCSLYPARAIRYDNVYGKIAPTYAAHFALLDEQFMLKDVIV